MKIAIITVFWDSNVEDYFLRYLHALLAIKKNIKIKDSIHILLLNNSKNPRLKSYIHRNKIDIKDIFFEVYEKEINGFAESNNYLAKKAWNSVKPDYFLFLNPDTEIQAKTIEYMLDTINSEQNVFCVDAHQLPYEHPKWYDNNKLYTSWCSGACMLTKAKEFISWNGFNQLFFMYAEDVDISWRAWENGYKCKYALNALCTHHCYGPVKDSYFRQFWNIRNGILMRIIHGKRKDVCDFLTILLKSIVFSLKSLHLKESVNIFLAIISGFMVGCSLHRKIRSDKIRPEFAQFFTSEYAYHKQI